jgi:hypothetical protein
MRTTEITLNGYHATAGREQCLMLGTAGSRGNERLHIVRGTGWKDLTVKMTFYPCGVELYLPEGDEVDVPWEATTKPVPLHQGKIVFNGIAQDRVLNTTDLEYTVCDHSSADGNAPQNATASVWQQWVEDAGEALIRANEIAVEMPQWIEAEQAREEAEKARKNAEQERTEAADALNERCEDAVQRAEKAAEGLENITTVVETPAESDLDVLDGEGNVLVRFAEGHIQTKNFDSSSLKATPEKLSELENDTGFVIAEDIPQKVSELQNDTGFITADDVPENVSELKNDAGYQTADDLAAQLLDLPEGADALGEADLDISDAEGNVLVRFASGHVQTLNFDSSKVKENLSQDVQSINYKLAGYKYTSHKGYHAEIPQNTVAAFLKAIEMGFGWLELDVRKTADNIYVLAHNPTALLYKQGSSKTSHFVIAETNYEDLCACSYDAAAEYKVNTFSEALYRLKGYNATIIVDLKEGDNTEITHLASTVGMIDRIILTYKTQDEAQEAVEFLNTIPTIPIRIHVTDFAKLRTLQEKIRNKIYAQPNASAQSGIDPGEEIPLALAANLPMIFAGCTPENVKIWGVLATAAMALDDNSYTIEEWRDNIQGEMTVPSTFTLDTTDMELAVGAWGYRTAHSTDEHPSGWIYGYIADPTIATLAQTQWGCLVVLEVTGVSVGSTELVVFNAAGYKQTIQLTVTG